MRLTRCLFAMVLAAACCAHAAEAPAPEKENFFKRLGKQIANDAKAGAKQAGKAYGDLGRSIGHGSKKTVKNLGHEIKESAEHTKKAAKETF